MKEDKTTSYGYLNGTFSSLKDLQVSVLDRGFIYGDGCYEVVPVYHKIPFLLQEHLKRWYDNLNKIRLPLKESNEEIVAILKKLLSFSSNEFDYIYLQATRGTYPKREHIFPNEINTTIFAYFMPFIPPTFETASKGISAITRRDIRWERCDIKSISLLGNILLRQESQDLNAGETILLRNNIVTEASVSNVFIVKSAKIITPALNNYILPGITRAKVLELAKKLNIPYEESSITEKALRSADEIWLTSSTKEIVPVSSLDGISVLNHVGQSIWKQIFYAYQKQHG